MSAPFKVQAQAKAKGEKLKAGRKGTEGKKKPRKGAAASKTKGGAARVQQAAPAEKVEYEPEPAGEDDHAFFDDEENADYTKFMLSLDSSGLSTFSKRAKDRVAVPPVSKKKSKQQHKPPDGPASSAGETGEAPRPPDSSPATVVSDASPAAAAAKTPPTVAVKSRKKEAVVDAKRRNASTAGWAVTDSGPERLPIKTRRGLLKPNERMQQQQQQQQQQEEDAEAIVQGKYEAKYDEAANGSGGDKKAAGAEGDGEQREKAGSEQQHSESGGGDMMSDDVESFYDSADNSELEDYTMDDVDDSSASGVANGSSGRGASKVDLAVLRQRRFEQKKALMGELCESILGAPEESLVRPKTVAKGEDERSRMEQLSALVGVSVTPSPVGGPGRLFGVLTLEGGLNAVQSLKNVAFRRFLSG